MPDRPLTKRTVWDETKWGGAPAAASPPLPAPLPVAEQQIAEQRADDHAHDIPSSYLEKGAWQIARLFCFLLRCVHAGHTATAAMIWQAKKKSALLFPTTFWIFQRKFSPPTTSSYQMGRRASLFLGTSVRWSKRLCTSIAAALSSMPMSWRPLTELHGMLRL